MIKNFHDHTFPSNNKSREWTTTWIREEIVFHCFPLKFSLNELYCSLPACLPPIFIYRKRPPIKSKKSPVGSWRSFFNLGKSSSMSKRKLHRNPSEPNELKAMALAGESFLERWGINSLFVIYMTIVPWKANGAKSWSLLIVVGGRGDTATLRSAKSEESLSSLHNVEGNHPSPCFPWCFLS